MCYEYVFLIWLYILTKSIYDYYRRRYSKNVFHKLIYTLLLELLPLLMIYMIINNKISPLLMRKNIISFVILILIMGAIGLGCFFIREVKKKGDILKNSNQMDEMPLMERKLYYRSFVFGDEYAWVICVISCIFSFIGLLWALYTGEYGEFITF